MIKPKQKDDHLLADIKDAESEGDSFSLWWLGQSGYLIKWQGKHLLIDPYLSDSLTQKYADTDKPHIRMTELAIEPQCLDFIDIVTSSHNHTDHLDAETLLPLLLANPNLKFIIPEANRDFVAQRLNIDPAFPIGLDDKQNVRVDSFKFTGVASAHEEVARDAFGWCKFLGYVIQFGLWSLYHSGDTIWYEGLEETLKRFSVDLAILPINGRSPERKVAGNLNAKEAVMLAKKIGAKIVIPCHYDMFTFNTAKPEDFVREAIAQNQRYSVLQCGERWSGKALKKPQLKM